LATSAPMLPQETFMSRGSETDPQLPNDREVLREPVSITTSVHEMPDLQRKIPNDVTATRKFKIFWIDTIRRNEALKENH
jgi:hypothetical protein